MNTDGTHKVIRGPLAAATATDESMLDIDLKSKQVLNSHKDFGQHILDKHMAISYQRIDRNAPEQS